jgi:hypothetical protein
VGHSCILYDPAQTLSQVDCSSLFDDVYKQRRPKAKERVREQIRVGCSLNLHVDPLHKRMQLIDYAKYVEVLNVLL